MAEITLWLEAKSLKSDESRIFTSDRIWEILEISRHRWSRTAFKPSTVDEFLERAKEEKMSGNCTHYEIIEGDIM